jgi:hypothetical protein
MTISLALKKLENFQSFHFPSFTAKNTPTEIIIPIKIIAIKIILHSSYSKMRIFAKSACPTSPLSTKMERESMGKSENIKKARYKNGLFCK